MKKNLSTSLRITRLVVAAVLAGLYFSGVVTSTWGIVLLVVAAIMLITALAGYCPLLALFCNGSCPFSSHSSKPK